MAADTKITLSFSEEVIAKAKKFADANNISLSRLTELLYEKITSVNYKNLEDLPISDWVNEVAEGEVSISDRLHREKRENQNTSVRANENLPRREHSSFSLKQRISGLYLFIANIESR